jgi:hypothetical protein
MSAFPVTNNTGWRTGTVAAEIESVEFVLIKTANIMFAVFSRRVDKR